MKTTTSFCQYQPSIRRQSQMVQLAEFLLGILLVLGVGAMGFLAA